MARFYPPIHPAVAPLMRVEAQLRREGALTPDDPIAEFKRRGGVVKYLPAHDGMGVARATAIPKAGGIAMGDELKPTAEQAMYRTAFAQALSDALAGGGTKTPMKDRSKMKHNTREWFRTGQWRTLAAVAGFDLAAKEIELRKLGLIL